MLVRNWMQPNPVLIPDDMFVSEARRVLAESNFHALPVVTAGKLRGLVTRQNLLRTAHFVLSTQNPDELNFFVTRLKVKDIMVRNPATVQASDTMEYCLAKGRELGVAQFPVLEASRVIGIISANEILQLAAQFLGAWEQRSGVTLAPLPMSPGVLGRIADVVEGAGGDLQALYPIGAKDTVPKGAFVEKRIIVRFHAANVNKIVAALETAGFRVLESVESHRPALSA